MISRGERAALLRERIFRELERAPERVGVALSGGVDSTSVLVALLKMKRTVTAYTFCIRGRLSRDLLIARTTAKTLGVDLVEVPLPSDPETVAYDVKILIKTLFARMPKKTAVECLWPFIYLQQKLQEDALATGFGADSHFGISKKAMIHHRHSAAALDEYRIAAYANPDTAQIRQRAMLFWPKQILCPYRSVVISDLFLGVEWDEINRPMEKQTIRSAFPELDRLPPLGKHTNLQKGDSGIVELFERAAAARGWRSPTAWYNAEFRAANGGKE